MSESELRAAYYPPDNEVIPSFAWAPCLKCGAMVWRRSRDLHIAWHESA